MTTTRKRPRALRTLATTLMLALLVALLLAGTALAAGKPGKPTAKAPKGTITTVKPTFAWSKAKGAAKYELRVSQGSKLLLKKTGLKKTTWTSTKALATNASLTWKVRASNARGAGAWSRSLAFKVVPLGPSLKIGDAYGGGIVAYIDGSGAHGLIAGAADQTPANDGIQWATEPYWYADVPGARGTAIGAGAANTDAIIAQNRVGTTYAAGLARAYTGGGYSDWYLPSKDELSRLYVNRAAIGGFASAWYWSSSQNADFADLVWYVSFNDGYLYRGIKSDTNRVRAVRAF
jgi:uncharacterized membrane protein